VQGTGASERLPTVLVVPLTTQQDALRFPGTTLIEADSANGLRRASVALTFQLTVLDQRVIGTRLGAVSESVMEAIWRAFDEITERGRPSDENG
jgi:mRNA-degrading endonuclease toxin of MazEF toxin-antitoxin module